MNLDLIVNCLFVKTKWQMGFLESQNTFEYENILITIKPILRRKITLFRLMFAIVWNLIKFFSSWFCVFSMKSAKPSLLLKALLNLKFYLWKEIVYSLWEGNIIYLLNLYLKLYIPTQQHQNMNNNCQPVTSNTNKW